MKYVKQYLKWKQKRFLYLSLSAELCCSRCFAEKKNIVKIAYLNNLTKRIFKFWILILTCFIFSFKIQKLVPRDVFQINSGKGPLILFASEATLPFALYFWDMDLLQRETFREYVLLIEFLSATEKIETIFDLFANAPSSLHSIWSYWTRLRFSKSTETRSNDELSGKFEAGLYLVLLDIIPQEDFGQKEKLKLIREAIVKKSRC